MACKPDRSVTLQRYEGYALRRWLSAGECAEYLDVSVNTLYHRVAKRSIPFVKVPGSNLLRFDRAKIDEWLQSGAVETVAENLKGGELQNADSSPPA